MKTMRFVHSALIILALLPASGCDRSPAQTAAIAEPLVRTVVLGTASPRIVSYTGVVRARIEAELGFRVAGKIIERLVDPGQAVRRGQALMRLDPTDLQLALSAANQRLLAAGADAVRAAAEERRYAMLVRTSAVSRSDYDRALASQRSTAANLEAARAAAAQAADEKSYAVLEADSEGLVTDVLAQPGQVVAPGTPVVTLARTGAREALVSVPETALAGLPRTGTARIFGALLPVAAALREVAGSADPLTRTYAVRFTLGAGATAAPLGATVTVQLRPEAAPCIEVPLAAVHDAGAGPGIWAVGADSTVSFRPVHVVAYGDETLTIGAGGVAPGTRIVALGAQLLREGEHVRLLSGNM